MDKDTFHQTDPEHENGVRRRKRTSDGDLATGSIQSDDESVNLKRNVGLVSGTALIVGTMIGSGIFISPKGVSRGSGSVGLSVVSWAICGILAMLGSVTWMELGTMIPESGGEYAYLKGAFGGLPAFLYSWVSIFLLKPSSVSIIALTSSQYMLAPAFEDGCGNAPILYVKLTTAAIILILVAINCYSVKLATFIQVFFTAAKLIALIIIIVGGIVWLIKGNTAHLDPSESFDGTIDNIGTFAIGLYNGMWAYDGWNNLNTCTEEIKDPMKNLPRAILIGLPLVTILYLLVNISYFTVMDVPALLDSPAVAVTWADSVIAGYSWVIPVFVALSTFGAANGTLFTSGRLNYVAARNGHMTEILAMVHVRRYTPFPSLVFTAIMALIFIIPGDIESLVDFFSFAIWLFYALTALACIVMRFATPYKNAKRPIKVPLIIPIIFLLISLFLVIAPIVDDPQIEFLYAGIFIVGGIVFYFPFVYLKLEVPCMKRVTTFFQLLFQSTFPN